MADGVLQIFFLKWTAKAMYYFVDMAWQEYRKDGSKNGIPIAKQMDLLKLKLDLGESLIKCSQDLD